MSFLEKIDFISFGTNDLTQMCLGFSRDDSAKFLNDYLKNNIIEVKVSIIILLTTIGPSFKNKP